MVGYIGLLCWGWFFHPDRKTNPSKAQPVALIPFQQTYRSFDHAWFVTTYKQQFQRNFLRNFFGNLFLFFPLGVLVHWALPNRERSTAISVGWRQVALGAFLLSLSAESLQYFFRVGFFDVDDILLNMVGALIGYAASQALA